MKRHDLRRQYREGEITKIDYARALREGLNRDLEEYCSFMAETDIAAITLGPDGVALRSAYAPVEFGCVLDDLGTPPLATLTLGTYEALEMRTLLLLLGDARSFVDVGANIGWYSVHAAALFPSLAIVAFEPVPSSHEQLLSNLRRNQLHVTTEQVGLSDTESTGSIYVSASMSGAASMLPSRAYDDHAVEPILLTTLDLYTSAHGIEPDVLKVDVEGAELLVLRGAEETLRRNRPAVMAEMLRLHSAPYGYHPNEIIGFMDSLGYHCLASTPQGWAPFARMEDETVETNFLFLHRERHASCLGRVRRLHPEDPIESTRSPRMVTTGHA